MRSARLWPLAVILLLGLVTAAWIVVDTARDTPRPWRYRGRRTGSEGRMPGLPLFPNGVLGSRYAPIGNQPRLFANLAGRAGPYLVSVRQLFAEDRVRSLTDLLPPTPIATAPLGRCQIVLQINTLRPEPAQPSLDTDSIRAVTESGRILARVPGPPDMEGPLPLQGAWASRVILEAVPEGDDLLHELSGVLVASSGQGRRSYGFRIRNVPLPTHPRLFGEVVMVRLKREYNNRSGRASPVLVGTAVESSTITTPYQPEARLPFLRLVLASGEPADLSPALSSDTGGLSLTAVDKPEGHIEVTGRRGTTDWHVTVWDREPFIVALPRSDGDLRGIQIMLSRSAEPVFLPMAQALFPAEPGQQAGSLAFYIRILGRPLGPAMLPFTLQRMEETGWSSSRSSSAPVKASGLCIIASLAPGRYRLVLHPERASPMGATRPVTMKEYLETRYGVRAGVWRNTMQEVEVAPGRRTYAPPLYFEPRGEGTVSP